MFALGLEARFKNSIKFIFYVQRGKDIYILKLITAFGLRRMEFITRVYSNPLSQDKENIYSIYFFVMDTHNVCNKNY